MKTTRHTSWIGYLPLLLAVISQPLKAGPYSGIVVFGDSLSDTGNYATRYIEDVFPSPYDGGRWSNGPMWVEVLAERLGLPAPVDSSHRGTNYAWGGGTTGSIAGLGESMSLQLQRYLQRHQPREDELFIVWGGANDFAQGQTNPLAPVGRLTDLISRLSQAGARNFLVANLPERIGIYPDFNNRLAQRVPTFNRELWAALDKLERDNQALNIIKFDFHELYETIESNPSRFGFSNLEQPACGECARWDASPRPAGYVFREVVANPDEYYLWDDVHPSAAAHRVIGEAAYSLLVPEPSAGVLMIVGAVLLIARAFGRSNRCRTCLGLALAFSVAPAASAQTGNFTLSEATVVDINRAFDEGILTSERLVQLYLNRIAAYDDVGPALNTMITLNPAALETARALDAERRATGPRSPLHGVPVVIKDQLDVFGLPTTHGARALRDTYPPDDAFIVRKLRDAGAIILGKTNLDEFGCCSITLSSLGGRTLNPYSLPRVVGGSSGGTAAAIAANFAVVGTGADWWGSIQEPASLNGVVGLMPTRSLVSGDGSMLLSERRGVIGPMARTVADAAAMLDVIVGVDLADPVTAASAGKIPESYLDSLDIDGLRGARIGLVQNFLPGGRPRNLVNAAVDRMRALGAEIVNVQLTPPSSTFYNDFEYIANRYLETLGPDARFKNIRQVLASGEVLPGQGLAQGLNGDIRPQDDPKYAPIVAARNAFELQVLAIMDSNQLDALIYPPLLSSPPPISTAAPIWETANDYRNLNPSPFLGFPSITLPIGVLEINATESVPYGIEFLGRPFSEPTLIRLAYSYEQATQQRVPPTSTPPLPGETLSQRLGDFNLDGVVDAADYVVWRKGLGTAYTQNDYDVWRAHFGLTAAAVGSASFHASRGGVPEPCTLLFSLTGIVCLAAGRRCRQRTRLAA